MTARSASASMRGGGRPCELLHSCAFAPALVYGRGSRLHSAPKTGPATSSSRSLGYGSCPSLRHFAVGGLRSGARTARRARGGRAALAERTLARPSGDHVDRHDVRRALLVGGVRPTFGVARRHSDGSSLPDERLEPVVDDLRQFLLKH